MGHNATNMWWREWGGKDLQLLARILVGRDRPPFLVWQSAVFHSRRLSIYMLLETGLVIYLHRCATKLSCVQRDRRFIVHLRVHTCTCMYSSTYIYVLLWTLCCHCHRHSGQELSTINESSVVLSPSDVSVDPGDLDEVCYRLVSLYNYLYAFVSPRMHSERSCLQLKLINGYGNEPAVVYLVLMFRIFNFSSRMCLSWETARNGRGWVYSKQQLVFICTCACHACVVYKCMVLYHSPPPPPHTRILTLLIHTLSPTPSIPPHTFMCYASSPCSAAPHCQSGFTSQEEEKIQCENSFECQCIHVWAVIWLFIL